MFEREANFVSVFTRIVKLMCAEPEQVSVAVSPRGNRSANIQVTVTAGDAKRLVGSMGSHFAALRKLARIGSHNLKRRFVLEQIASYGAHEAGRFPKFVPRQDWDRNRPVAALIDLVDACFPESFRGLRVEDESESASKIVVTVSSEHVAAVGMFADCVATVYETIGVVAGRILHAEVRNLRAVSARDADSR